MVTAAELANITARTPELSGWDFSSLNSEETPPPWRFSDVVRKYLDGSHWVVDIGTGGGEAFLHLASDFERGFGIDNSAERLLSATENARTGGIANVAFVHTSGTTLPFPDETLDVVLARYSDYAADEVYRVLRSGGTFVTIQMGDNDTANIFEAFGWGTYSGYWRQRFGSEGRTWIPTEETGKHFVSMGCEVTMYDHYDLPLYFKDVEALVFYLKASPLPEPIDPEKHWFPISRLVEQHATDLGIRTNQHRELLVVKKP